ncbi:sugar-transfer associated ATP-grasp domain-containing protein [Saccharicrinis sp. GN24d3]|uniref:sugar-transfer associated ATP-grasp domain-containing protein n=1 Tax=Saccharicrinis sp. GN24d3 TaxID=3458416 RepID=UPI00403530B1
MLTMESICDVFIFNISIKDYYQFRFFELSKAEKSLWAGSGYMYEYQLRMNPKGSRHLLEDKIEFLKCYKPFIKRSYATLSNLRKNHETAQVLLNNKSEKLVVKGSMGQVGGEVEVLSCKGLSTKFLIDYMEKKKYDLVEEYVIQHKRLMDLSPSGLNTVRIFTQLNNGDVDIIGARLRITVNSPVDNMAAGNLAAPIDVITGKVNGSAVYSDIVKDQVEVHPVTKRAIVGFQVPYWDEVVDMAKKAALHNVSNKSIGWDVAIGDAGPEIIEGNHNWCKLLWQLPVKKGLKDVLIRYA